MTGQPPGSSAVEWIQNSSCEVIGGRNMPCEGGGGEGREEHTGTTPRKYSLGKRREQNSALMAEGPRGSSNTTLVDLAKEERRTTGKACASLQRMRQI